MAEAEGGGGPLCPATGMAKKKKALGLQQSDTCALVSNISLSSKALLPCSTFSLLLRTYFFLALLSCVVHKERVCLLLYCPRVESGVLPSFLPAADCSPPAWTNSAELSCRPSYNVIVILPSSHQCGGWLTPLRASPLACSSYPNRVRALAGSRPLPSCCPQASREWIEEMNVPCFTRLVRATTLFMRLIRATFHLPTKEFWLQQPKSKAISINRLYKT